MPASTSVSRWYYAVVGVIAVAAFWPTLGGGFIGDDFAYVARFAALPWSEWPRLFTHEWSDGLWGFPLYELRPSTALTFMVDARLYGGWALGYRLTNLALLLGATMMVMQIAARASRARPGSALTAGLLFALHPVIVEPTAWITGRVDGLATLLALAFWLWADVWAEKGGIGRAVGAVACFAAGIFGKEFCLLALPLLTLWWIIVPTPVNRVVWQRRAGVFIGALAAIAGYAWCRHLAFGANIAAAPGGWHDTGSWSRQLSYLGWISGIYPALGIREGPANLPAFWSQMAWAILATTGLLALAWARWQKRENLTRGLYFLFLWYLGTTGILLAVGYFSPRHLCFPAAGWAIGLGVTIGTFSSPWKRNVFALSLLAIIAAGHWNTQRDWREAGTYSRELIAALQAEVAKGITERTTVILEVSEIHRGAYLWAWASPQLAGRPFVSKPFAPKNVFTRTAVYYRPDDWAKDLNLIASLRAADAVVLVRLRPNGSVVHRRATPEDVKRVCLRLPELTQSELTMAQFFGWIDTLLP